MPWYLSGYYGPLSREPAEACKTFSLTSYHQGPRGKKLCLQTSTQQQTCAKKKTKLNKMDKTPTLMGLLV